MLAAISMLGLKGALYAIPGANFVLIAFNFIRRFWKPIALTIALVYTFHAGVKHERKKHDTAQLSARLAKAVFERDNIANAMTQANADLQELTNEVQRNVELVNALKNEKPAPVAGTCDLSADTIRRLRNIKSK